MSVTTTTNSVSLLTDSAAIDEQIYVYDSLKLSENMSNIKKILMSNVVVMPEELNSARHSYSVKGKVYANVTYLGENDRAENLTGTIPFEFSSEGLSAEDEYLLDAKIINYEAVVVRQRRIDLNVSVGLKGLCLKKEQCNFISSIEGKNNIQVKKARSEAKSITSKSVTVPVTFELGGAELEQAKVLCASVNMKEYSTNSNYAGIMLSATLCASAVVEGFSTDESYSFRCLEEIKTAASTFEVPADLAYDEYYVSACCVMNSVNLSEAEGEAMMSVDAEVIFNIKLVRIIEWESVCDAFSVSSRLDTKLEEQSCMSVKKILTQRVPFKQSKPLSPGAAFYRVGSATSSISCTNVDSNAATLGAGKLNIDAYVLEGIGGEYELVNIAIPFAFEGGEINSEISGIFSGAETESLSFYCEGGLFVAEGVIKGEIIAFEEKSFVAVTDCDETEQESNEEDAMKITVVYYDEANDLWETAKKNRTSVRSILEANLFEKQEDIPPGTPLVIKSHRF